MTREQEQQCDWEELSRLREENRLLRTKNAELTRKINALIEKLSRGHQG